MTITLRGTKGVELTHAELDGNFTDLDGRVTTLQNATTLDSAATIALIDSSYVQSHIDSDHVQARSLSLSKYYYEADSGDTVFTGADLQSNTLSFDSSTIMVYKNGILLHELYDFTLTGKNTVTLTMPMDSGHDLIITSWT